MKKTLSVVLALVMVLVMSLSAFAAEKPADSADVAAWTDYYKEVLADTESDPIDLAAAVVADVREGVVSQEVAFDALESAALALGTDAAEAVLLAVADFLGFTDAPVLPDVLPEDEATGCFAKVEGIFDVILGAIGDFAGSLFADPTSDYCLWPDCEEETTEAPLPEPEEEVPPLGDNSLFAIGTVALVAGAALVLTRKKDKDAE